MLTRPDPAVQKQRKGIAPAKAQSDFVRKMSLPRFQAKLDTPFGLVGVRTVGAELAEIVYLPRSAGTLAPANGLAQRVCAQIEKYLADPGFRFKLPLKQTGTAFQRRVWHEIASIPRGQTRTYGDIARVLRSAPRAVGQACGANYYPLVIPCHRVVAANGLGGFAHHDSGYLLEVKRWLLQHERHGDQNA
jgi:methylated-DNA-[protein]-cysteine S-methyltransferase